MADPGGGGIGGVISGLFGGGGGLGEGISGIAGGIASLFGSKGDKAEASAFNEAASIASKNADIAKQSTGIQVAQATRNSLQVVGGQIADVGGAGLAESGSALDLLRDTSYQTNLQKQIVANNGLLQEQSFRQEAASYKGQAQAAQAASSAKKSSGIGGLISGAISIGSMFL